jgi:hypothetical protein
VRGGYTKARVAGTLDRFVAPQQVARLGYQVMACLWRTVHMLVAGFCGAQAGHRGSRASVPAALTAAVGLRNWKVALFVAVGPVVIG